MTSLNIKNLIKVCLLAGFLTSCSTTEKVEVQTFFGYSMGTSYSVKVVGSLSNSRSLQIGVEGVLSDIDNRMSTYLVRSDISVFSAGSVNENIEVDTKTADVVFSALRIAGKTEGYFDPTVAPLVDLWGFGPDPSNRQIPNQRLIDDALGEVGFGAVSVDVANNTVKKSENRRLDLSAIAKGYAVDQVSQYLEQKGFTNYLVEVGGEMRISGEKPNNSHWKIAIESPDPKQRDIYKVLDISTGAVATSGNYRNFFELNGKRYSHTINPKTGYPVEHDLASVTVFMNNCMDADAFATAFMAMGRVEALKLANQLGIAIFMIYEKDEQFYTQKSEKFVETIGVIKD